MAMGKCSNKIRHIVRIRQMLRRWRQQAAAAAVDVPSGHVAVCVGATHRRYIVRAAHLNHPLFRRLLAQCEDEFGFSAQSGPLALPSCDEAVFEEILLHISSSAAKFPDLEDIRRCCYCHVGSGWHSDSLPLLRGLVEKPIW